MGSTYRQFNGQYKSYFLISKLDLTEDRITNRRNSFVKAQSHCRATFRTRPNIRNSSYGVRTDARHISSGFMLGFVIYIVGIYFWGLHKYVTAA